MKKILVLLIVIFNIKMNAYPHVYFYYEESVKKDTISYYFDNNEIYPVSIYFSEYPVLKNMKWEGEERRDFVIAPNTKKQKIVSFILIDKTKNWGIINMPSFKIFVGDFSITEFDENYIYDLPYRSGRTFQVSQGYGGTFSHQDQNAIDFTLPDGTAILAAREGKVVEVVHENEAGCETENCANQGNYITIIHDDGTVAEYYHIEQYGAQVKVGQDVKKGDFIAFSGNTGFSKGSHLHFVVYIPSPTEKNWKKTIKTKFRTAENPDGEFLESKKEYRKP